MRNPINSQDGRVHTPTSIKKSKVSLERLVRQQPHFTKKLMISVGVSNSEKLELCSSMKERKYTWIIRRNGFWKIDFFQTSGEYLAIDLYCNRTVPARTLLDTRYNSWSRMLRYSGITFFEIAMYLIVSEIYYRHYKQHYVPYQEYSKLQIFTKKSQVLEEVDVEYILLFCKLQSFLAL